jgi:hypothetical protein
VARDWIDPSQAAQMFHNMNVALFRRRYVNPVTRDCTELVIQVFNGPKGQARYKILTASVIQFLQSRVIHTEQSDAERRKALTSR